jgi:stage II sporulation protein AA (anti-sigma F factor antagonist)
MSGRESAANHLQPDMGPLLVKLSASGPTAVITVEGELTFGTTQLFNDIVDRVVHERPARPVILDLARVTFCCSAGIHALIHAHQRVTVAGGRLVVREPSQCVYKVLVITGDDQQFEFERVPSEAQ